MTSIIIRPAPVRGAVRVPVRRENPIPLNCHPNDLPDTYVMRVNGTCMEPVIEDGAPMLFSRTERFDTFDLAVLWWRPEHVPPGAHQGWLKQIMFTNGRFDDHGYVEPIGSNLESVIIARQINPHRVYRIHPRKLLAVHKCTGPVPAGVQLVNTDGFMKSRSGGQA